MPRRHLPPGLLPVLDAIDAAEAAARQDQTGRAVAHLTCARLLLQVYGMNQTAPAPDEDCAARIMGAMALALRETPADVVDLAQARAARERGRP